MIALNSSNAFLQGVNFTDNNAFSAVLFAGFQSFTNFASTTFEGGSDILVVFIDQDSNWDAQNPQFINIKSLGCTSADAEKREFVENVGEKCFFRGGSPCAGVCGRVNSTSGGSSSGGGSSPSGGSSSGAPASAPTVAPATNSGPVRPTIRPTTAPVAPSTLVGPTINPASPTKKPTGPTKPIPPGQSLPTAKPSIAAENGTKSSKKGSKKAGTEIPESLPKSGTRPIGSVKSGAGLAGNPNSGTAPAAKPKSGTRPAGNLKSGARPAGNLKSGARPAGNLKSGARPAGNPKSGARPAGTTKSDGQPSGNPKSGVRPAMMPVQRTPGNNSQKKSAKDPNTEAITNQSSHANIFTTKSKRKQGNR